MSYDSYPLYPFFAQKKKKKIVKRKTKQPITVQSSDLQIIKKPINRFLSDSLNSHTSKMGSSEQTQPNPATQQQKEEEEVGKLAVRLANAAILPMVLKSAMELNLIDIISEAGTGAFLSPLEIAAKLPTKNQDAPVLLDRMLRLLASYSILKCTLRTRGIDGETDRLYGVESICKFLVKNPDGGSVAPLFLLHHDKVLMESW